MTLRQLPTGIARTATGYRAFVWVPWPGYPKGRVRSKRFTRTPTYEPTEKEMEAWREDRRVEARRKQGDDPIPIGEGFLADAETYLAAVQTMVGFKDRRRHIREWAALFGERPRAETQAHEIRAQRDQWLTVGPKHVLVKPVGGGKARWETRAIPLSASTVNQKLRALENLYTLLGGRDGYNPVREVDEAEPPEELPKGETFALAYEILSHMTDLNRAKKGEAREAASLSRIRFETMLMTGMPPNQLGRLLPAHVHWDVLTVTPPKRAKGRRARRARARRKVKPRQLMPAAIPVLRRFFALGANQPFSPTSLGRSVKRAIRTANKARAARKLPPISETLSLYDLTRHTFGTEVFRLTKNLLLVKDLLGHATLEQSERYAQRAIQEHQVVSVGRLSRVARRAARAPADVRRRGKVGGKVSPPKRSRRVRTRRR